MSASSLADVFEQAMLSFKRQSGVVTGHDAWGNPVFGDDIVQIEVRVKVTSRDQLIQRYGADGKEIVFEASLVRPAMAASYLQVGLELDMFWHSREGIVTIRQYRPRALRVVDEVLGQRLILSWRPRKKTINPSQAGIYGEGTYEGDPYAGN